MAALPEEFFMVFQEKRLRTFKDWPFKTDCLCTAEKVKLVLFKGLPLVNECKGNLARLSRMRA